MRLLTNAGFKRTLKGNGSSGFRFEPTASSPWAGMGAITFHRPHKGRMIDPDFVSEHARRMCNWFRWSRESFELEVKSVRSRRKN